MAETAAPKSTSCHQRSLPRSAVSGARAAAGSAVTDAGIPDGLAGEGVTARSRRSSHRVGGAGTGSPADGEGGCAEQAHAQVQQVEQQAESDGLFAGDVERAEEEQEGALPQTAPRDADRQNLGDSQRWEKGDRRGATA